MIDSAEPPASLSRNTRVHDGAGLERDSFTLDMVKGSSEPANTLQRQRHVPHWLVVLPCNQAPRNLRSRIFWGPGVDRGAAARRKGLRAPNRVSDIMPRELSRADHGCS